MTTNTGNDNSHTQRSMTTAYLLWFFLGGFGVHRMYMGKMRSGLAMLGLFVATIVTLPFGIGLLGFPVMGIWWIADAIFINKWFKPGQAGASVQAAAPSTTIEPPMSNAA